MSSFDLFGEFKRQAKLSSLTEHVRTHYNRSKAMAVQASEDVRRKGVQAVEQYKQAYADKFGLPTAESSIEEKIQYRDYMKNTAGSIMQQVQQFTGVQKGNLMGPRKNSVAAAANRILQRAPETYEAQELADAVNSGWSNAELHTGVLDIINKTADARNAALGITRFRGTDGAMSTLNAVRSLFYKDNTHLNDGVVVAGVLGGTLATGMAVGKAIGTGLDAVYVDRN